MEAAVVPVLHEGHANGDDAAGDVGGGERRMGRGECADVRAFSQAGGMELLTNEAGGHFPLFLGPVTDEN